MTARRTLLANASFTGVSAVVLIAARDPLYPLFGLTSPSLLTLIGIALLLYAGSLVLEARREPPQRYALVTAALLDAGWVVGSVIVLVLAWPALAPGGRVLIIAAALVVEVFAVLQFRASRTVGAKRGDRGRTMKTFVALSLAASLGSLGQRHVMGDPPGRLIDVQGQKLHLHCTGSGSPTVVIDGGAGAWSIFYAHIQKAISGARVCTYDRAGLGWSEPRPGPRTSERMAEELHLLLHAAGVKPPLALVGHSLGGYNVRIYQARYPEEVAALVLLDAAHEEQWERLPARARDLVQMSAAALAARAAQARVGAIQPKDVTLPGVIVEHAPELRDAYVAAMLTPEAYETLAAETLAGLESARQVPRRPLGDLPLVVLTARRSFEAFAGSGIPIEASNAIWLTLQHELAALSKRTQHVFSDGDHRLNESDPAAVIRAIELAIAAVKGRSGAPPALVPFGPGHMIAAHQKCPLDHGRRIRSTLGENEHTDAGHLSIRPLRARRADRRAAPRWPAPAATAAAGGDPLAARGTGRRPRHA